MADYSEMDENDKVEYKTKFDEAFSSKETVELDFKHHDTAEPTSPKDIPALPLNDRDENENYVNGQRKLSTSSASSVLSHEGTHPFARASDTSDMRLIVEGKPLYVSRLVLSIISPVFKDMFEKRARELSLFEIPLSGKKYDEMLEFLYSVYPDSLKPISGKDLPVSGL